MRLDRTRAISKGKGDSGPLLEQSLALLRQCERDVLVFNQEGLLPGRLYAASRPPEIWSDERIAAKLRIKPFMRRDNEHFSHVRGDERIVLSVCRHCLRVVAYAPSPDKLKVAETAHIQRCHRPTKSEKPGEQVPLVPWSNSFSVNIASLDDQHALLVGMVNVLSQSVAHGEGNRVLGVLLDGMVKYTKAHFAHEEALMAKHRFAGLADHKAEHKAMTAEVQRFKRESAEGHDNSARLLQFLREWFSNHICGADQRYSAFLRDCGER